MKYAASALALTLSALALSGTAMAHDISQGPAIAAGSTLLTISADGHSARTPDLALFSAGVTTQGKTAGEALTANSVDMNKVIAALKKAGIADKDIQTSNLSINAIYGQPTFNPTGQVVQEARIIGYQANNQVSIKQRDLKSFGKVLDALVAAGANQVNGPNFTMNDPDAALDEARIEAMKKARSRAELYAKASGLRVARIVSISEAGGWSPPMPVIYAKAEMARDAAPTPVSPGQVESQVSVTVLFELTS